MWKYGVADYKKVSNNTSSLLATILLKFSTAIVFTYKNLSSYITHWFMSAFKHTIVTIYYNSQTYLEYFQFTTGRGNKFQLGDKITHISRT